MAKRHLHLDLGAVGEVGGLDVNALVVGLGGVELDGSAGGLGTLGGRGRGGAGGLALGSDEGAEDGDLGEDGKHRGSLLRR